MQWLPSALTKLTLLARDPRLVLVAESIDKFSNFAYEQLIDRLAYKIAEYIYEMVNKENAKLLS